MMKSTMKKINILVALALLMLAPMFGAPHPAAGADPAHFGDLIRSSSTPSGV